MPAQPDSWSPEDRATVCPRLVCIQPAALTDSWPAVAAHVEALPNAAELLRTVGGGMATLWAVYCTTPHRFFDVAGVAVVGVRGGSVAMLASTPGFVERWPELTFVAHMAEAHRAGCYWVTGAVKPEQAQLVHDVVMAHGMFQPSMQYTGAH